MTQNHYIIDKDARYSFSNHTDFCIGSGRLSLALRKEYQNQLRLVQQEIGFKYIRAHSVLGSADFDSGDVTATFSDVTYTDESGTTKIEYNFTYLDMIMDFYQEIHIKPFLELGFMPYDLASGDQLMFFGLGNVTPPKDYTRWTDLVKHTLLHLCNRYGLSEVLTWPIEIWNEPNIACFWVDGDLSEYFKLYRETYRIIKDIDSRFIVGGPACSDSNQYEWVHDFLTLCIREDVKPDYVSIHQYTITPPIMDGHYGYPTLIGLEEVNTTISEVTTMIKSFEEFRTTPIYITEFNTAYQCQCPIHDTNQNAAYISKFLMYLNDISDGLAYWTFGDCFEECGIPFTPFSGSFGLVANGGIKKPTFYTFQFYKQLKGRCIHRSKDSILTIDDAGHIHGLCWNNDLGYHNEDLILDFTLPADEQKSYCLLTKLVDEKTCNPQKTWVDLGAPKTLSPEQNELLLQAANPLIQSKQITPKDGMLSLSFVLKQHAILSFELFEVIKEGDRGFSY